MRLLNYKRVSRFLVLDQDFPRNAAMKVRRVILAGQIGKQVDRSAMVTLVNEAYFAIVNPAAGGGRCGKLAAPALDRLRAAGLLLEVRETRAPGEATVHGMRRVRRHGFRKFIAVGGDGTSFEIVNGLFPDAATQGRASWDFFHLGPAIRFFATSSKMGRTSPNLESKPSSNTARAPATSSAWTIRAAPSITLIH